MYTGPKKAAAIVELLSSRLPPNRRLFMMDFYFQWCYMYSSILEERLDRVG